MYIHMWWAHSVRAIPPPGDKDFVEENKRNEECMTNIFYGTSDILRMHCLWHERLLGQVWPKETV